MSCLAGPSVVNPRLVVASGCVLDELTAGELVRGYTVSCLDQFGAHRVGVPDIWAGTINSLVLEEAPNAYLSDGCLPVRTSILLWVSIYQSLCRIAIGLHHKHQRLLAMVPLSLREGNAARYPTNAVTTVTDRGRY